MAQSIFVVTITVINAFLQVTNANPQNNYHQSNGGNQPGQNYHESQDTTHIGNFGNGNNKHNFVKLDENPDSLSVSGASYGLDASGRPSQQNLQVNLNNPPKTRISNIGNGVGNRNVFVLNDNRQAEQRPYYDDRNFRGSNNRQQPGEILSNANIGRGSNNANKIYVNGQRINVDPNNAVNFRFGASGKEQDDVSSTLYDVTRYANNFGNGHDNKNIIRIDDGNFSQGRRTNFYGQTNRQTGNFAGEKNNLNKNVDDASLQVLPLSN